jgi:hypothetical protein
MMSIYHHEIFLYGDYLMHSLFKAIIFIAAISSALAMEREMVDATGLSDQPPPRQTKQIAEPSNTRPIFIIEPSFSAENEDHYIPVRLNTLHDVENIGCEVCCLTTSRKFWTFMTGPLSFLGGVANSVKTALSTTAVVVSDTTIKKWLGVATTIASISSFTCNVFASYGTRRATTSQHELAEIEEKSSLIIEKYMPTTPLLRYSHGDHQMTKADQEKLQALEKRYKNLTKLSHCEKSCFSYSNCILRNTQSATEITAHLLDALNIVMVPLATIPVWHNNTLVALNIAILCIEGTNIVVKEIIKRAQLTNNSMIKLEKALLGENNV